MFFRATGPVLSADDLKAQKFKASKLVEFPAYPESRDHDDFGIWSKAQWEAAKKAFLEFTGPVLNPDYYVITLPYVEDSYTAVVYKLGAIELDLVDEVEAEELIARTRPKASTTLKVAGQGPNDWCSCNSGKRFKKCCMYKR